MPKRIYVIVPLLLLCLMPLGTSAEAENGVETALQVQSWCRAVVNATFGTDGRIRYTPNHDTGFCWGAFGVIQQFSRYGSSNNARLLRICPPPNSTRVQFIKIFSKYVDDHPATANQIFPDIARRSLVEAFPCTDAATSP